MILNPVIFLVLQKTKRSQVPVLIPALCSALNCEHRKVPLTPKISLKILQPEALFCRNLRAGIVFVVHLHLLLLMAPNITK